MFYTVYQITNTINDKIYVGCHKTNNLDDGYMGSGKLIKRAIKKYGIDKFKKDYLDIFDDKESMLQRELEIVSEDFVANNSTYNLKVGGEGGFDHLHNKKYQQSIEHMTMMSHKGYESRQARLKELQEDPAWVTKKSKNCAAGHLKSYREGRIPGFKGKTHSNKAKNKISEANKISQKGKNNSQFGKVKSEATKEKARLAMSKKEMLFCPYCDMKSRNKGAMNRWHFDNCKEK